MSKDNGWKIENENSGASFNLGNGDPEFKNANMSYRDEKGNEITRERFHELKVDKLERLVSQLAQELTLKVDADKVVSAINVSSEGIRINGDKIEINGETLIEDGALERKGLSTHFEKEFAKTVKKVNQSLGYS